VKSWEEPPKPKGDGRVKYQIVDSMTGQVWSCKDARTIYGTQLAAIGAFNNSRHARDPSFSAQTRYRVRAFKIGVVE